MTQNTAGQAQMINELNEKFNTPLKMERMFGSSLMGFPLDADSNRQQMFTSNLKQILVIAKPDIPRVLTGHENKFGEISHAYKDIQGDWVVKEKIEKFPGVYTLVIYCKKTDTYDMVERRTGEALTEKFGFLYDTKVMDSLKPGDKIKDGTVLYKSTSYDWHMNYRNGVNAKVMYQNSCSTIEDAVCISKSFAERIRTFGLDRVTVSINDNDILLLMHGNKEEGLRTLPRLGEEINDATLCATRRIVNNRIMYDLREEQLTKLLSTDSEYVVPKHSYVYDVNVFYNNEKPFPDNVFFKELKYYYDANCKYADDLLRATNEIKDSGANYTKNVTRIRSNVLHWNDPEYKWKGPRDTAFNNIIVEFRVVSESSVMSGSKLVGRYGDKGVVSSITDNKADLSESESYVKSSQFYKDFEEYTGMKVPEGTTFDVMPDESMPYGDDGLKVDIKLNASGAFRRINSGQLFEVEINFCTERLREYLVKHPELPLEEKLRLIFKLIKYFNPDECKFYSRLTGTDVDVMSQFDTDTEDRYANVKHQIEAEVFVKSIEKNGIYIWKPPAHSIRYDEMKAVYEDEDFKDIIKPYQLYVDKFGRKGIPIMRPCVVGDKYMYALKQNTKKNFSARSTGRITKAGIPAKSTDKKDNRIGDSNSPIRLGEVYNLMSQISGTTLATHNIFTRTSPLGRQSLRKILETEGHPLHIKDFAIQETFVNANVQMLQARLKTMGIGYEIISDKTINTERINAMHTFFEIHGMTFFDTMFRRAFYARLIESYIEKVRSGYPENEAQTWDAVMDMDCIKIIKPPKDIVKIVKTAMANHPVLKKSLMEKKEKETE